jgi:hypothetical protein
MEKKKDEKLQLRHYFCNYDGKCKKVTYYSMMMKTKKRTSNHIFIEQTKESEIIIIATSQTILIDGQTYCLLVSVVLNRNKHIERCFVPLLTYYIVLHH